MAKQAAHEDIKARERADLVDLARLEKVFADLLAFISRNEVFGHDASYQNKRASIIAGLQHDLARIRESK